jgi:hypothetical protein
MKTNLVLVMLSLVFSVTNSHAQYIPMLGNSTVWHEYYSFEEAGNYSLTVTGDSVVNGVTYKIVLEDPLTLIGTHLLREDRDERKVFEYIDDYPVGHEDLLYDFSLSASEQVEIHGETLQLTAIQNSLPDPCFVLYGDSVSCSLNPLRVYRFGDEFSTEVIWIEGIGSAGDLIQPEKPWCGDTKLLCHYDSLQNQDYYYHQFNQVQPCEGFVAVSPIESEEKVKVYPNPTAQGEIYVEGKGISKVRITSIQGQFLEEITLENKRINRVTLKLSPGVYLLESYSGDNKKSIMKFIIN